ncbi:MAG: peptidylprolyl isomerase [Magnetococcales bacterium]|nr:peptidylprolyl isomerase [Magnetococcales bacterium]
MLRSLTLLLALGLTTPIALAAAADPAPAAPVKAAPAPAAATPVAPAPAAQAPAKPAAPEPEIAAKVNEGEVRTQELNRVVRNFMQAQGMNPEPINSPEALGVRKEMLDVLIDKELLRQEAAKQKIVAAPDKVKAELERLRSNFKTPVEFQEQLSKGGITEERLTLQIASSLAVQQLLDGVNKAVTVKDEEVKAYYDAQPDSFTLPDEFKVRHILLAVEKGAPAEQDATVLKKISEIAAEIKKGGDFGELARKHSQDGSAQLGGDLGLLHKGETVPEFEQAFLALKPGQVSDPVRSPFGYHLIKLEEVKPPRKVALKEVMEEVREFLTKRKQQHEVENLLKKLKEQAKITVNLTL